MHNSIDEEFRDDDVSDGEKKKKKKRKIEGVVIPSAASSPSSRVSSSLSPPVTSSTSSSSSTLTVLSLSSLSSSSCSRDNVYSLVSLPGLPLDMGTSVLSYLDFQDAVRLASSSTIVGVMVKQWLRLTNDVTLSISIPEPYYLWPPSIRKSIETWLRFPQRLYSMNLEMVGVDAWCAILDCHTGWVKRLRLPSYYQFQNRNDTDTDRDPYAERAIDTNIRIRVSTLLRACHTLRCVVCEDPIYFAYRPPLVDITTWNRLDHLTLDCTLAVRLLSTVVELCPHLITLKIRQLTFMTTTYTFDPEWWRVLEKCVHLHTLSLGCIYCHGLHPHCTYPYPFRPNLPRLKWSRLTVGGTVPPLPFEKWPLLETCTLRSYYSQPIQWPSSAVTLNHLSTTTILHTLLFDGRVDCDIWQHTPSIHTFSHQGVTYTPHQLVQMISHWPHLKKVQLYVKIFTPTLTTPSLSATTTTTVTHFTTEDVTNSDTQDETTSDTQDETKSDTHEVPYGLSIFDERSIATFLRLGTHLEHVELLPTSSLSSSTDISAFYPFPNFTILKTDFHLSHSSSSSSSSSCSTFLNTSTSPCLSYFTTCTGSEVFWSSLHFPLLHHLKIYAPRLPSVDRIRTSCPLLSEFIFASTLSTPKPNFSFRTIFS